MIPLVFAKEPAQKSLDNNVKRALHFIMSSMLYI
jgi:hypothetical protein